jgi:ubiquinone/menaquinone biosynthesis C-methylase UbiE
MSERYGLLSMWRDTSGLDAARARELAFRNLEPRGQSPDEIAARSAYLDLLALKSGERVLDIGCGTGVVTRDAARRVAPDGRAVGVDTSAEFLALARSLAHDAGLSGVTEFRQGDALALPFGDGAFDAVLAVTVLVHVPDGHRAIPEMVRVARSGGRVGVFDLDGDGVLVSHPDRALTRRIIAAFSDQATVDGWLGRRLPGLLRQAGLVEVGARGFVPIEQNPAGFYARMAERAAEVAAQSGAITDDERRRWLEDLAAARAAGDCLVGRVHLFCWGTKP